MKIIVGGVLLLSSPLMAHASCYVRPLTTAELTANTYGTLISGQIIQGEECRGVGSYAAYTADHYSFQGKVGDVIVVNVYQPTTFSGKDLDGYIVLLDPSGTQIAQTVHIVSTSSNPPPDTFTVKLTSSGVFKLVVTGYRAQVTDSSDVETINYEFDVQSSSPVQTLPVASCLADGYSNGKLTINSVTVPNGSGGLAKYKVTLNLQPATNPAVFTIDKAELLPQ